MGEKRGAAASPGPHLLSPSSLFSALHRWLPCGTQAHRWGGVGRAGGEVCRPLRRPLGQTLLIRLAC